MDDNGSGANTDEYRNIGHRARGVLPIVCVALFFGVLNASAIAVVLPDIAVDLSVETSQLSWLMTGFLLIYGIAIPFYGRLADRYGARSLFLLGVGVFSVGSLLSALAPNYSFLLAARIIQAVGGAAVPGLGMALASRAYGPEARGTVLGMIAATIGLGAAIGPLLGGALSESLGWQSIFVVNTAAAITIPIGLKVLPRDEDRARGHLDIVGGVALAVLVGGVLLVSTEGPRSGWSSLLVLAGAIIAIIGLVALPARQLTAGSPFIPREFLRSSRYVALVWMSFSVMAANLAVLIGLPIFAHYIPQSNSPGGRADDASRRNIDLGVRGVGRSAYRPIWGASANVDGISTDTFGGPGAFNLRGVVYLGHFYVRRNSGSRVWIGEHPSGRDGVSDSACPDAGFGDEYQFDAFLPGGQLGHGHAYGNRDLARG